jgi:hypothetical protein
MGMSLPLNKVLPAIDKKDRGFWDRLSDEEKKAFSPFLYNRYSSTVKGDELLQQWYLRATNERTNKNFFDVSSSKHPKLHWLLLTTISPKMGTQFHQWIPHKKKAKSSKKGFDKTIRKLYPNMKEDEIQLLSEIITKKELKEQLILLGWQDADIKAELK